jgi:tRNA(Ile)-lysidine synthase
MSRPRRIDWPAVAAALAGAFPRSILHPAVTAWAENAPRRGRWAVGLSGGADSVVLLLLLWAHWPGRRKRLRALHFDHRLRGAASRADARFCRDLCAALGVELVSDEWREAPRVASEAQAREARMAFFRRQGRVLWLGHQQDDIAETFFMRLARGSGTAGLAAPRPVGAQPGGRVHLRPLLTLPKAAIVDALRRAGGVWREDETNAETRYLRNRLRRTVLPAWARAAGNRDALAGAARSRALLEEDDTALEAWLAEIAPLAKDGALNLRRLAGKPRGLVRRALRLWLERVVPAAGGKGKGLSRQAVEALLDDVMRGRRTRHSVGPAGLAVIGRTRLIFSLAPSRKIAG